MTRAEYQAKYGTQPTASAPVKMTRLEYDQKYGTNISQPEQTSLVEKVANAAPTVGGVIGGITGGLLGGTAGSAVPFAGTVAGGLAGSGAGTALGTMGGHAIKNSVLSLFGKQKKSDIDQLKDAVKESAIAGATDVATGAVLHGAGKVISPVVKSVGKVIEDIPLKSIRVNPSQITKWGKTHGEDLSGWMVKNKILGENSIDIAEKSADALQQSFDDLAMSENITIPVSKLRDRFSQEIKNLAGASGGTKTELVPGINRDIAEKVLGEWNSIQSQIDQMGIQDITPAMLTRLRRTIDETIPKNAFASPSVKNFSLRMRRLLSDVVQEGVDSRLIGSGGTGSLKRLGKELSKYYDFLDIAERQSNLGRGSLLANLPRILSSGGAGTIGAMLGGVPGAISGATAGLVGEAAFRSPEVLNSIYKTGLFAKRALPKAARAGSAIFQRLPSAIYTLSQ